MKTSFSLNWVFFVTKTSFLFVDLTIMTRFYHFKSYKTISSCCSKVIIFISAPCGSNKFEFYVGTYIEDIDYTKELTE